MEDPQGTGTVSLIAKLKEHKPADLAHMNAIRREFLKKVFVGFIESIQIKSQAKYDSDTKDDQAYASSGPDNMAEDIFNITTQQDKKMLKEQVVSNLE